MANVRAKTRKVSGRQKEKLFAKHAHVGIEIDSYDEIFSDFDPRPFKEKSLSDDFLSHLRRHYFDRKPEYLDLVFLVPQSRRHSATEAIIKKRLHIYFQKSYHATEKEISGVMRKNLLITAFAVVLMVAGGVLSAKAVKTLADYMITTFIEPASWFLFWTSLEAVMSARKKYKSEQLYFKQLADCKIVFYSV